MRRAQSIRTYGRNSLALASDELGALREAGESDEDVLRRQLLEKDRLVDEVRRKSSVPAALIILGQRLCPTFMFHGEL